MHREEDGDARRDSRDAAPPHGEHEPRSEEVDDADAGQDSGDPEALEAVQKRNERIERHQPAHDDDRHPAPEGVACEVETVGALRHALLEREHAGDAHDEQEPREDEVGRRPAVPLRVVERPVEMCPVARVVDEDHPHDGQAAKQVEGCETPAAPAGGGHGRRGGGRGREILPARDCGMLEREALEQMVRMFFLEGEWTGPSPPRGPCPMRLPHSPLEEKRPNPTLRQSGLRAAPGAALLAKSLSLNLLVLLLSSCTDHPPFAAHDAARRVPRPPRREARGGQRSANGNRGSSRRERAAPRAECRRGVRGRERHQARAPDRGGRPRARGPLRPDRPLEADRKARGCGLGNSRRVRPWPHAHQPRPASAHGLDLRQHGGRPLHRSLRREGRERAHGGARPARHPARGPHSEQGRGASEVAASRHSDARRHGRVLPARRNAHPPRPGGRPAPLEAPRGAARPRPSAAAPPRRARKVLGRQVGQLRGRAERLGHPHDEEGPLRPRRVRRPHPRHGGGTGPGDSRDGRHRRGDRERVVPFASRSRAPSSSLRSRRSSCRRCRARR